jgi:hypothetical protein
MHGYVISNCQLRKCVMQIVTRYQFENVSLCLDKFNSNEM